MNVSLLVENVSQIKSGTTISVCVSVKIRQNIKCVKKYYICNPATCSCENSKYVEIIIGDSVITCVKIMEETNCSNKSRSNKKYFNKNCYNILISSISY